MNRNIAIEMLKGDGWGEMTIKRMVDVLFPLPFKKNEVIAVRDSVDHPWVYRRFSHLIDNDDGVFCFNESDDTRPVPWVIARPLSSVEQGES